MKEYENSIEVLEAQIRESLSLEDPASERYTASIRNLETLERIRKKSLLERIDPNQVIAASASLGGIFAILRYEKMGVIASKAFSLISKIRL